MKTFRQQVAAAAVGLCLAALPLAISAAPRLDAAGDAQEITFSTDFAFSHATLRVTGPADFAHEQNAAAGDALAFTLGPSLADGDYSWHLLLVQTGDGELRRRADAQRPADEKRVPFHRFEGTFRVEAGSILWPSPGAEVERPQKDQIIADDLAVYGGICAGTSCGSAEVFGSDSLRFKEVNNRIHFDDTSTGSYPANDWRLVANSSASGGASYFAIEDSSATVIPFLVEAGAPVSALYVESNGRVGFGTGTPVDKLHAVAGDTPALRLEQDASSSFTPQTWRVAGNETNFFIEDTTGGSTLPLRIRPGASSNALYVDADDDIGIGTATPAADSAMHIVRGDKNAQLRVQSASASTGNANMLYLENNGKITIRTVNNQVGETWDVSNDGNFNISKAGTTVNEMSLADNGDLTIQGRLRANNGSDIFPDYVFRADYPLMPLDRVAAFIDENGHLPKVPSADDIADQGFIDMTGLQLTLLEKVEELTLYTLSQEETIQAQEDLIRRLTERLDALESAKEQRTE